MRETIFRYILIERSGGLEIFSSYAAQRNFYQFMYNSSRKKNLISQRSQNSSLKN